MRRYFFILLLIFMPCLVFIGCSNDESYFENAMIKIGETEYSSLAEAIEKAESGETILIFNDVKENEDSESLLSLTNTSVNNDIFVAYEIDKPITIKGVIQNGKKPVIYGSFYVNITNEGYKENSVTIENLNITHGYVDVTNNDLNEKFSCGVRVISGSANIIENEIHLYENKSNDIIQTYDLPLCYGVVLSRPKESAIADQSFTYEIAENKFGDYSNMKDGVYASAFSIVQNYEDVGAFLPAKLNRESTNFSLSVYENNIFSSNSVYAMDYDGESMTYKSLVTSNKDVLSQEKLNDKDNRTIFIGDLLSNNLLSFDIYGWFVVTGNAQNVELNLKEKEAVAVIERERIGKTQINQYSAKNIESDSKNS